MTMLSMTKTRKKAAAVLAAYTALRGRRKQQGFTLLELLVVVAILAAIAGVATVAFQDTDRRASAAAHVASMDSLNGAIKAYKMMESVYPDYWDSMMTATTTATAPSAALTNLGFEAGAAGAGEPTTLYTLTADDVTALSSVGIENVRVYHTDETPEDGQGNALTVTCADPKVLINSKAGSTAAMMFLNPEAGGCGADRVITEGDQLLVWTGGQQRVLGRDAVELDSDDLVTPTTEGQKKLLMLGIGPSLDMFTANNNTQGAPIYRHVKNDEYNRFIALFQIATATADSGGTLEWTSDETPALVGVVDGALDTKEEELGEWDGKRAT